MQIAAQTHKLPMVQKMSSTMEIKGQKLASYKEPVQTQTTI